MSNRDTEKYGYRDGAAEVGSPELFENGEGVPNESDYGYGEGDPDVGKYGYEEGTPDAEKYGYGDGAPKSKERDQYGHFGYVGAAQVSDGGPSRRMSLPQATRRSSLKTAGSRRRSSIQATGEIEVYILGQDKPVRRRRSIAFDESVRVQCIEPVSALTDKPQELWFQSEEYNRIRSKSLALAGKAISGNTGGKNFCFRGLENLIERGQAWDRKENAWDAVLDEQHYQRDRGAYDDEYLANLYKFQAMKSKQEASHRAKMDAEEIANYMRRTRKGCRRLSL